MGSDIDYGEFDFFGEIRFCKGRPGGQSWALCNGKEPFDRADSYFDAIAHRYGKYTTPNLAGQQPYRGLEFFLCHDGHPDYLSSTYEPAGYIGQIRLFRKNTVPSEFVLCEGQLLPIKEHATLFKFYGTRFGGDGKDTFALPDLRPLRDNPRPSVRDVSGIDYPYAVAVRGPEPERIFVYQLGLNDLFPELFSRKSR